MRSTHPPPASTGALHFLCGNAGAGKSTVVGPLVIDLLAAGRDVVLDLPASTRASRAWYRSFFEAPEAAEGLTLRVHRPADDV